MRSGTDSLDSWQVRANEIVKEAMRAARSQPVMSSLTILIIAAMVLTIMLTTGRTVGAEQQVLSSIDAAGTRTVTVVATEDARVTTGVLDRLRNVDGIEWVAAFSAPVDAHNTYNPDGAVLPARFLYSLDYERFGFDDLESPGLDLATASAASLATLGLIDGSGAVTLDAGMDYLVSKPMPDLPPLNSLGPVVLIPQPGAGSDEPVRLIVAVAERAELVEPVTSTLLSVLAPEDPSGVTVSTSAALAELRGLVGSQLASFSRGLVLGLLGISFVLVVVLLSGLVLMRRKDFGRRRALGATRGLIVALILSQTGILAAVGIVAGLIAALVALGASSDPLPDGAFISSIAILSFSTAVAASVLPAWSASRREPMRELRVP